MEPANGAADLDPKAVTKLVVTFDRPMSQSGWSFCGSGPQHPKFVGKPRWETPQRIVFEMVLEPDHEYYVGLNCPSATNFRSAAGVPLEPMPWTFSTAGAPKTSSAEQKAENQASFDALKKLLAESYSYYDLRSIAWDALFK
jgi:hypothetical protein